MKTRLITILIVICTLLTGCREHGEIENTARDLYYLRTDYYNETFCVVDELETDDGIRVKFTADPDYTPQNIYETKPNVFITTIMTPEQYAELIDDYEVFEASMSLITVVDPETGYLYTYMTDLDAPIETTLIKAKNSSDYSKVISKDKIADYLRKFRFVYYKL